MGNNKRVLKAIDRELKDRYRSKRYSKSLSATNSLFAPNYLFSKPSKRRIYNPNAKYFDHGGVHGNVNPIEGDLYSKVLMNRNRGVGFVDRAFALGENPGTPLFNVPDDEQFGSYMSHKMAYGSDDSGQTWMYPTIFNDADEAIKVPNQYADYISSEGYKNATGMVRKHGGPHDPPQESAEGQKDWMMNYIQSPMYLKRLSKEFPDYSNEELEVERNARLSNVKNVNIKYPRKPIDPSGYGNISGVYYPKNIKPGDFSRRISTGELVKDEIDNSKSGNLYLETPYRADMWFPEEGYNTIPLHEIGHAADDGGSRIPYKTEKFIYDSTNKAYAGPLNYDVLPWDNATKVINELPFKYKNTPTEFINRLIPLRYELERAGIWKPGEEDFIDGMYNLMLKNPDVMKNAHIQDVLDEIPGANESRSKRAIVTKLLNEIALSDVEQDLNVAKHGGPHNPPTEADSLKVYNNALKLQDFYDSMVGSELKAYDEFVDFDDFLYTFESEEERNNLIKAHLEHDDVSFANKALIRRNTDPNLTYMSDYITGAIDPRAPLAIYDKRIKPQGLKSYESYRSYLTMNFLRDEVFDNDNSDYNDFMKKYDDHYDSLLSMPSNLDPIDSDYHEKFDAYMGKKFLAAFELSKSDIDPSKLPQYNYFLKELRKTKGREAPGVYTTIPYYDPIMVKPWSMLTEEEKEYRRKFIPKPKPKGTLDPKKSVNVNLIKLGLATDTKSANVVKKELYAELFPDEEYKGKADQNTKLNKYIFDNNLAKEDIEEIINPSILPPPAPPQYEIKPVAVEPEISPLPVMPAVLPSDLGDIEIVGDTAEEDFNNDYKAKRVVDKETHYKVNKKGKIRRGPFGKKTTRRVRYELPEEEQLYPEGFVPRFKHGGPHDPPEKKSIITNKNNPNYVYKDYAKKYGVDLNSISAEDIEALIKNQRAVQDYWQNQQNLYKPLTSAHTAVGIMLKPEDRNDYLRAVSKYHIIPGNKNYLDDIDGWGLLDYKNLDLSDKGIRRDDYPKDLQKFIMDNTTDNISYLPQAELAHDDFEHKQGYDDFPLVRVDNRFPISGIPAYQQIDKKCTNCPSVNIPKYDPVMLARLQNQKTLDDWSYEEINDIGEIEVPSDIDPGTAKSGYKPIRRGLQFFKGEKRRNNNAIQKGKGFFGKNKRIKQQGGSIEAELTDKEVERYRAGGYILEEMHEGGEPGHTHDGDPPEKKSKDQKFRERWNLEMKQNQDIDNTFHIVNQRPLIGLDGVDPDAEYNAWIDQNIDYGTNPNKSWITSAYEGLDDLYHLPANLLAEDYSSYSTRDKAFAQARADGKTSFMYNGKRFNTRREDDDIKLTFETDDPDEQYVFQHLTDETKKEHPILWNLMNKASGIDEISFDGVGSRWISNFDEKSMQEKNRGYYHEGFGLGDGATIHVGETPFEDGTYERFINVLIAELAHRTGHQPSNNPFHSITHKFKSAYENIKYGDEKRYQIPGTDEFNNHRLVEPGIHMTVRGKMTPAIVKKVQNFLGVEEDGIFGEDTYLTMVDRFKDNELIKQMLEEYAKRNPKDKHPELPISFGEEALWATYLNVLSAHVPELSKSTGSWKPYVETVQNMGKFIIPFTKESFKDRKITDFNIRELQSFLAQQGYELPNSVVYVHERYGTLYDGILGDETKTAFKNYRKKLGYKKQGGSVGLGDEVDEATMQRLKEQGYTFEEI